MKTTEETNAPTSKRILADLKQQVDGFKEKLQSKFQKTGLVYSQKLFDYFDGLYKDEAKGMDETML